MFNDWSRGILNIVRGEFDLKTARLGLRGPAIESANMYFSLDYFGDPLGLSVVVEFDRFSILAYPFKTLDTDVVPGLLRCPDGHIRKLHMTEALDKLRIRYDAELTEYRRLAGDWKNCEAMTKLEAGLVEKHWATMVANADKLFPGTGA